MDIQKAKIKWHIEGDENTKLFHSKIKYRERNNLVRGVHTENGSIDDPQKIKDHFFEFFKGKFDSRFKDSPTLGSECFSKITDEESRFLERPFEEGEIWAVIKSCGGNNWARTVLLLVSLENFGKP